MNYQLINRLYFLYENCLCPICLGKGADTGAKCAYLEAGQELERLYAIAEIEKVLNKC